MKELCETMMNGTAPICSGAEGLESAIVALAIDKANTEAVILDLEPVWEKLKR